MNDPLSHVLFDDDVPDELRDDPEYARAQADVAALRRGLRELAATTPQPAPPVQTGRWNGGVILAVAACTLLAVTIGGMVVSQNIGGPAESTAGGSSAEKPAARDQGSGSGNGGGGSGAGPDLTEEGLVACATQVVDGVIEDILPGPRPETSDVLVDVTYSYKPQRAAERMAPITVTIDEPTSPEVRVGAKALLVISRFPNEPPLLYAGTHRTDALERFGPSLRSTNLPPCPGPG